MKSSGFKAPLGLKKEEGIKPQEKNIGFDFTCPEYDERTSCFINAGTHYGVGYRQPVGHTDGAKMDVPVLPRTRKSVHTQKIDETG
jgi:hypothetical protein